MAQYADYHFKTEEKYMLKYKYPEFDIHKREHQEFLIATSSLCFDATDGDEKVPEKILNYLESWLINHILKTYVKLKPFFLGNNIKGY